CCPREIIKANERYVLRAAQPHLIDGLQSTDDHLTVRHEERRRPYAFLCQELQSTALSPFYTRIAFNDQCRIERNSVGFERLLISGQPLLRGDNTGETSHDANPLVPKR